MRLSLKLVLICHLLSILVDSAFQFAAILMLSSTEGGNLNTVTIMIIQTLFFLPFVLLGPIAGSIADKYSKTIVFKYYRFIDVVIMLAVALCFSKSTYYLAFPLIFLKGTLSALNSPIKLGLLPELSDTKVLSNANGIFQMFVVLGAIFGTLLGGQIVQNSSWQLLTYLSLINATISFFIKNTGAKNPASKLKFNPYPAKPALQHFFSIRPLYLANLAIAYFWALAAFYKINVVIFAEQVLLITDETYISILLVAIGIGIAVGSVLSAKISFGRVEIGLVPIGAFFISVTSFLISYSSATYLGTAILLFALGFFSGIFIIPLTSYFQSESNPKYLGTMFAIQNQISFTMIILMSIVIPITIEYFELGVKPLFFIGGLSMLAITIFLLKYIPQMLLRFLNWILINTFYKIKINGREKIPEGGALLISNHISFVDASLIQASLERPVHFLMFKPIYDNPFIHPIASKLEVIPIEAGKKETVESGLQKAKEHILAGDLVCIFPEGAISRIGVLQPFKRGMEKIMTGISEDCIVPVYIDKVWGSIFSFKGGKFIWKFPREIPYPISISFGDSLPATTTSNEAYQKVEELGALSFIEREELSQSIPYRAIKSLRRRPFNRSFTDSSGLTLNSISFLSLCIYFAKELKRQHLSQNISLHLPNCIPAAALNLAILILGRTSVNLNGTADKNAISESFELTESSLLITSHKYQEKLKIEVPPNVKTIYVEDIIANFGFKDRLFNLLFASFFTTKQILRKFRANDFSKNDTATIIFSSGSTGIPKGVMLSHKNIISNIEGVSQVFETDHRDTILGCLPFFHSFGLTFTLWFPILEQIKVTYHPNPLDAGQIGRLAKKTKASILFATPTFLQLYLKKCTPEQFSFMREVMVGAEKLTEKLSEQFEEKFGVEPKEGYGCTELSPLALVNSYNIGEGKLEQKGKKTGTVGLPIPGVTVKIVDPDTFEKLKPNENGLLLVKGANVMLGYLKNKDLTDEVIKDGWYVTGDIAMRDDDGFVKVTDRLSRFSKIGGEMIPHIKIEELIQEIVGTEERMCVVSAVPDEKKGERIIVLYREELNPAEIVSKLSESGIPNIFIPKVESFKKVDSFPLLATGKLDLNKIKEISLELA